MSWQTLSNQIKTKLESISDIQVVYDYPWLDFDGYPAVTITPSEMESDYETQQHNIRTYAFMIRAFLDLEIVNQATLQKKVEKGHEIMRGLIDSIVDTFDKDETLSGISMPTGKTLIAITPVPARVLYFEEEKMMIGEVRLFCKVSFDITT